MVRSHGSTPRPRAARLVAVGLALAALAVSPAPAGAQSAGDKQYRDPLAGEDQGGSPARAPARALAQDPSTDSRAQSGTAEPAASAAQAEPRESLPHTGLDSARLAVLGAALLASGVLMRVGLGATHRPGPTYAPVAQPLLFSAGGSRRRRRRR